MSMPGHTTKQAWRRSAVTIARLMRWKREDDRQARASKDEPGNVASPAYEVTRFRSGTVMLEK